jgi:hypothetical protein
MEVPPGIEPGFTDLQSVASPLCHGTPYGTGLSIPPAPGSRSSLAPVPGPAWRFAAARLCWSRSSGDPVEMMASTTLPFAVARQFMVDSQLRPNKVSNASLLEAMRQVPRETFLPPPLWSVAYADQDVRLGGGRVLIAPLAFARLAQLLDPVPGERVLVVGSGTGYGAAVLATCGARVTALDPGTPFSSRAWLNAYPKVSPPSCAPALAVW